MADITQNNGEKSGVFTALKEAETAGVLEYNWTDENTFDIVHTEVDPSFNGHGLGNKLVEAAVEFARKENKKIVATCPFAKSVLEENSAADDVYIRK